MEIFRVDDGARQIHAGRSWVAADGTRHPKSWTRWSDEEKAAAGITTVVLQSFPDQRLYNSHHADDGSVVSTARALDDVGEGMLKVPGVRSNLIAEVKQQQASLLALTDWAIVRKADNGTAIPAAIQSWRDALRSKSTAMETAIANAADTDAVAALFLSWDVDGNKSGVLYDWPELDE
jgi:hypothetical protein